MNEPERTDKPLTAALEPTGKSGRLDNIELTDRTSDWHWHKALERRTAQRVEQDKWVRRMELEIVANCKVVEQSSDVALVQRDDKQPIRLDSLAVVLEPKSPVSSRRDNLSAVVDQESVESLSVDWLGDRRVWSSVEISALLNAGESS